MERIDPMKIVETAPLIVSEPLKMEARGLRRGNIFDSPSGPLLLIAVNSHPSAAPYTLVSGRYLADGSIQRRMPIEDVMVVVLPDTRESLEEKIKLKELSMQRTADLLEKHSKKDSPRRTAFTKKAQDRRLAKDIDDLNALRAALSQLS